MANFPTKAQRFDANLQTEIMAEAVAKADFTAIIAIADPTTATAEDVANKVNEILAALKGA